MTAEELLAAAQAWHREALESIGPWRAQAREDYAFDAGAQWDQEALDLLREQQRPAIVFNRIAPTVDAVVGTEIGNRQELRFLPREMGDVAINELLTAAAAYIRDDCDAEHEESQAFRDLVVCGMGWIELRIDSDRNPEGEIRIERVDPLEMVWDPAARRANLADGRFVMRIVALDRAEAQAMFPGADPAALDAAWARLPQGQGEWTGDEAADAAADEAGAGAASAPGGKVTLVQLQWWERETAWLVQGAQGMLELDEAGWRRLAARWQEPAGGELPARRIQRRRYRQAFIGAEVLEMGDAPAADQFSFLAMTGRRDCGRGCFMGVVRAMKDPQRWANKWLSQALHVMNVNAKGGLMAEIGAFEDPRQAEQSWADPAAITWIANGGLSRVQPKPPAAYPPQLAELLHYAVASIRDVSGVNLELLGLAERSQAGVLEHQRKQAAVTILAGLFDSLRRYRKACGRVLLVLIRDYLSDGRLVRIAGPGGAQRYLPLVRDRTVGEYDVIVDEAPASPNQKERVFALLTQGALAPVLQRLPPAGWLALLDYFPLPESVIAALGRAVAEAAQPDPVQQRLQQARAEAELAETRAGAALDLARAQAELARAEAARARTGREAAGGRVAGPAGMHAAAGLRQRQAGPLPRPGL